MHNFKHINDSSCLCSNCYTKWLDEERPTNGQFVARLDKYCQIAFGFGIEMVDADLGAIRSGFEDIETELRNVHNFLGGQTRARACHMMLHIKRIRNICTELENRFSERY